MPVAGVGIKGDVADNPDFGDRVFHRANGAVAEIFRLPRFLAVVRLQGRRHDRKKRNRRNSQASRLAGRIARHCRNGLPGAGALLDEDGPNQILNA